MAESIAFNEPILYYLKDYVVLVKINQRNKIHNFLQSLGLILSFLCAFSLLSHCQVSTVHNSWNHVWNEVSKN